MGILAIGIEMGSSLVMSIYFSDHLWERQEEREKGKVRDRELCCVADRRENCALHN